MRSFMLVKRENHKILYFIRLVTNLNAKYSVSLKNVSGRFKASYFFKILKFRPFSRFFPCILPAFPRCFFCFSGPARRPGEAV